MKRIAGYFILMLFFGLLACQERQKELVFKPLSIQDTLCLKGTVLNDSLLVKMVTDLDVYDSCVFVGAYSEEYFLHGYHRETGKPIRHLLVKGRGPGELQTMSSFKFKNSGVLSCFDPLASKRHEYVVDSLLKEKEYPGKAYLMKKALRNVIPLENFYLSGMGAGKDKTGVYKRMYLMREDSVVYCYGAYPDVKNRLENDLALLYCFTGQMDVAPDGKRWVVATSLGAILEIFTLAGDSIRLEKVCGFTEPIFEIGQNQVYPIPDKTIWGFHDVYATDRNIYTIYSGNTEGTGKAVHLAVFDWQGNLVRFCRTDYRLFRICVDEQRRELYAVGVDSNYETVLVKFDLDEVYKS